MFGIRTPVKTKKTEEEDHPHEMTSGQKITKEGPIQKERATSQTPSVRRSIGDWESGKPSSNPNTPSTSKVTQVEPPKPRLKTMPMQESRVLGRRVLTEKTGSPPKQKQKYIDRLTEAKACVTKAKTHLGNSKNLKAEIKTEVTNSIERLYQLVKETENIKGQGKKPTKELEAEKDTTKVNEEGNENRKENMEFLRRLEEHTKQLQENNEKMEKLKETIEKNQEIQERLTYASVAAATTRKQPLEQTALHSVVVTAKDETETGEEVLDRIRKVVNAKAGGIAVEKIRKAKDRKVIVGCRTEEEREKIKERLQKDGKHLNVEEMKNKDPLVILKNVFAFNSDEDVLTALRNQNKHILEGRKEDSKLEIAYKKRTRNPHTNHLVLRVSPKIWQRMVEAGTVLIDLQRVRVEDQSPLVQCSLCLGYGHGRRFCKETAELCSHCGGPHLRTECADWLAGTTPVCCNCTRAKLDKTDHSAFSQECTIRRRWEALARSTIAYC